MTQSKKIATLILTSVVMLGLAGCPHHHRDHHPPPPSMDHHDSDHHDNDHHDNDHH